MAIAYQRRQIHSRHASDIRQRLLQPRRPRIEIANANPAHSGVERIVAHRVTESISGCFTGRIPQESPKFLKPDRHASEDSPVRAKMLEANRLLASCALSSGRFALEMASPISAKAR